MATAVTPSPVLLVAEAAQYFQKDLASARPPASTEFRCAVPAIQQPYLSALPATADSVPVSVAARAVIL
jgi:hypothetical protein